MFTLSEVPISIVVLGVLAALTLLRDNRRALSTYTALMATGLAVGGFASLAFTLHLLGPMPWMIAVGGGLYLAYTPYNAMLFDRLIAASGNTGFLIYVADACGYLGSVALVLVRSFGGLKLDWAEFLARTSLVTGVCGPACSPPPRSTSADGSGPRPRSRAAAAPRRQLHVHRARQRWRDTAHIDCAAPRRSGMYATSR